MLYYWLSSKATKLSRTKDKEQWFERSKAHAMACLRGSLMAWVLNFDSASFKSICSHCFCPVVQPSDKNWKLMKKNNQNLQWKTPTFQALLYPLRSSWDWVHFQKVHSIMQNVRRFPKGARKCVSQGNKKNWPAALQRKPFFHRGHLPKRSWQSTTRVKLIFLEEDCSFFSLWYYSWEVGKDRRKLTFKGSLCCLAKVCIALCYPLNYTTFWKFEEFSV